MSSKEFELLLSLIISMLKDGKTQEVIALLENVYEKADEDSRK